MPALAIIVISEIFKALEILKIPGPDKSRQIDVAVFILAALFSTALPVMRRLVFVNKVKNLKMVNPDDWWRFEKQVLQIALVTPYFFAMASVLQFNGFFYSTVFLLALYAGYFYFPSGKRIRYEMRIFRINEVSDE